MLIYFFIPILLYSLIKINIMTKFICFSLNVREMFRLKQISSHFSVADGCFFRRRRLFCACKLYHYSAIINPSSAPLAPLEPHPPNKLLVWVLRACHWPVRERANDIKKP